MCNPALIGLGIQGGQMLFGGAGASSAAEQNARLSDLRAADAINRGDRAEQASRRETAQILGEQRAQMGANNVDLSFGTPLEIQQDTAQIGELDALTIRGNAEREAFFHTVAAEQARTQAENAKLPARFLLGGAAATVGGRSLLGRASKAGNSVFNPVGAKANRNL